MGCDNCPNKGSDKECQKLVEDYKYREIIDWLEDYRRFYLTFAMISVALYAYSLLVEMKASTNMYCYMVMNFTATYIITRIISFVKGKK